MTTIDRARYYRVPDQDMWIHQGEFDHIFVRFCGGSLHYDGSHQERTALANEIEQLRSRLATLEHQLSQIDYHYESQEIREMLSEFPLPPGEVEYGFQGSSSWCDVRIDWTEEQFAAWINEHYPEPPENAV